MCTHEEYIGAVADAAIKLLSADERAAFDGAKLVYGAGGDGRRGVTYFGRWRNGGESEHAFVEIGAFGESDRLQLAGTTIHELAHVLAGIKAGHGAGWKAAAERLGLRQVRASGQEYGLESFAPEIRATIEALPEPTDGTPANFVQMGIKVRPCTAGIGTKGGTSRGKGSGSRLRKCECADCGYVARVASKWIDDVGPPHCPEHGAMQAEGSG